MYLTPETFNILSGVPQEMDPIILDWAEGKAMLVEWLYKSPHYMIGGHAIDHEPVMLLDRIIEDIRESIPRFKDATLDDIINEPKFIFRKVILKGNFTSEENWKVEPIKREPISLKGFASKTTPGENKDALESDPSLYICQLYDGDGNYTVSVITSADNADSAKAYVESLERYQGMHAGLVESVAERLGRR